mmetsp:Transcript_21666/g.74424  ORF Transcript_21666/g.74424 Transcript_21666/m.74424 type:complete len:318 (+) Transcript_21666:1152-2105(+)
MPGRGCELLADRGFEGGAERGVRLQLGIVEAREVQPQSHRRRRSRRSHRTTRHCRGRWRRRRRQLRRGSWDGRTREAGRQRRSRRTQQVALRELGLRQHLVGVRVQKSERSIATDLLDVTRGGPIRPEAGLPAALGNARSETRVRLPGHFLGVLRRQPGAPSFDRRLHLCRARRRLRRCLGRRCRGRRQHRLRGGRRDRSGHPRRSIPGGQRRGRGCGGGESVALQEFVLGDLVIAVRVQEIKRRLSAHFRHVGRRCPLGPGGANPMPRRDVRGTLRGRHPRHLRRVLGLEPGAPGPQRARHLAVPVARPVVVVRGG